MAGRPRSGHRATLPTPTCPPAPQVRLLDGCATPRSLKIIPTPTCPPAPQIRLLDGLRNAALTALPGRMWQDVVEVPIAVTAAFGFLKLLVIRCGACMCAWRGQGGTMRARSSRVPNHRPSPPGEWALGGLPCVCVWACGALLGPVRLLPAAWPLESLGS